MPMTMNANVASALAVTPSAPPPLTWAQGTVSQMLVQPGESFYLFAIREAKDTVFLRIGNAHTGAATPGVTADNPVFDLLKEAYFRKLTVEVGYRDFGPDPQAGINNLVIDRVSLNQ